MLKTTFSVRTKMYSVKGQYFYGDMKT